MRLSQKIRKYESYISSFTIIHKYSFHIIFQFFKTAFFYLKILTLSSSANYFSFSYKIIEKCYNILFLFVLFQDIITL